MEDRCRMEDLVMSVCADMWRVGSRETPVSQGVARERSSCREGTAAEYCTGKEPQN